VTGDLVVAENPDPDSRLRYLLQLPLDGGTEAPSSLLDHDAHRHTPMCTSAT